MKRLLREPLFHFLLLGAALFVIYEALNRGERASDQDIVVSAGQVESLAANFSKVWGRTPSPEELKGLIDEHVKEEILSREAVKLGLDQHDPVIRRRLQQKMEFLVEDFAAMATPTDDELAAYLAENMEKFQQDARFTFRQVYLNPSERVATLDADTAALLSQLRAAGANARIEDLGDRILLPSELLQEPSAAVSAQFGQGFADALSQLPTGEWSGPIASGYGQHLVFIIERTETRLPELDEVRRRVERDFVAMQRKEVRGRYLEELLQRYNVIVQWPEQEDRAAEGAQASVERP